MSKHTPGPWKLTEIPDDKMISSWHIQIGAEPLSVFPFSHNISPCGQYGGYVIDGEKMANATLIAAAPDLLAALQDIYAIIEREKTNLPLCFAYSHGKAANAIARAKGEAV